MIFTSITTPKHRNRRPVPRPFSVGRARCLSIWRSRRREAKSPDSMKKPLITFLHYTALPVVGGVEMVMADHAHLLTEAGFRVTILTGRGGKARKVGSPGKGSLTGRGKPTARPYGSAKVSVIREIDS